MSFSVNLISAEMGDQAIGDQEPQDPPGLPSPWDIPASVLACLSLILICRTEMTRTARPRCPRGANSDADQTVSRLTPKPRKMFGWEERRRLFFCQKLNFVKTR